MADLGDFPSPTAAPCTPVCQHMHELIVFEVCHTNSLEIIWETDLQRPHARPALLPNNTTRHFSSVSALNVLDRGN